MNAIAQSNHRLWMAIIHVRIVRTEASITELRDALNARRSARDRELTADESKRLDDHYHSQLRTYGRVEIPMAL